VAEIVKQMLGHNIVTKQTSLAGVKVRKVYFLFTPFLSLEKPGIVTWLKRVVTMQYIYPNHFINLNQSFLLHFHFYFIIITLFRDVKVA